MTIHGANTRRLRGATGCRSGLRFTSLDAGDGPPMSRTRRSRYRLVVTETCEHGLVTGGALCREPVEAAGLVAQRLRPQAAP